MLLVLYVVPKMVRPQELSDNAGMQKLAISIAAISNNSLS
jgi:hypothetical protein